MSSSRPLGGGRRLGMEGLGENHAGDDNTFDVVPLVEGIAVKTLSFSGLLESASPPHLAFPGVSMW